jgi:hypothetical protein
MQGITLFIIPIVSIILVHIYWAQVSELFLTQYFWPMYEKVL